MTRSELVDQVIREQHYERAEPARSDPALAEKLRSLEAQAEQLRAATRGIAPAFDTAVQEMTRAREELGRVPATLRQLAQEMPPSAYAVLERRARDSAIADSDRRAAAARQQLEAARTEVRAALLPDPPRSADRDRAERELADEIELADDRDRAFEVLARRYLDAGDVYAVRVLAGSWGRRRYRRDGGTDEGWSALQRQIDTEVARRATSPADRRRWAFVLERHADALLTILHAETRRAVRQ